MRHKDYLQQELERRIALQRIAFELKRENLNQWHAEAIQRLFEEFEAQMTFVCPVCDGELKIVSDTIEGVLIEQTKTCKYCGYDLQYTQGAFKGFLKDRCFIWGPNEDIAAKLFEEYCRQVRSSEYGL